MHANRRKVHIAAVVLDKTADAGKRNVGTSDGEWWFGDPIPGSGYREDVEDCGMSAAKVFDSPIPGLERIGTLRIPRTSEVPESSNASIGFEGLDRGLFDPNRAYDALAAAGIKWARVQTMWSRCEKEKGVLDFSLLDGIVDNLAQRGIRPWFSVSFGNTLYMDGCNTGAAVGCCPMFYGEECRAAWERYVRALARHYATRVSHWEIWNEPDNREFWRPEEPNGAEYLRLVRWTGAIIREEVPGARIGGCTSSPLIRDWERAFFEAGGAEAIDFWSFHAYGVFPERLHGTFQTESGAVSDAVAAARAERAFVNALGGSHVEFWQGESGFPSWFPANHWLFPKDVCQEGWQSQANQAKWLLRRFATDRRCGFARSSFYQTADISRVYSMGILTRPHPAEHGILDGWTYRPKMSYHAIGHWNALLAASNCCCDDALGASLAIGEGDNEETVLAAFRAASGAPLFLYYAPFDFSDSYRGKCYAARLDAALRIPTAEAPHRPVVVDLLRGGVYAVSRHAMSGKDVVFDGLPLTDYPLVLADADAVPLAQS